MMDARSEAASMSQKQNRMLDRRELHSIYLLSIIPRTLFSKVSDRQLRSALTGRRSRVSSVGTVPSPGWLLDGRSFSAIGTKRKVDDSPQPQSTSDWQQCEGLSMRRLTMDFSIQTWPQAFGESKEPRASGYGPATGLPLTREKAAGRILQLFHKGQTGSCHPLFAARMRPV